MQVIRNIFDLSVVLGILLFAPFHYLIIEVIQIPETSSDKEVVFDESDQPLDFTFGIWMPRLTQSGIEAYCVHEVLIVRLPYWMVLEVPLDDDTFHVVCQNILGDPHVTKGVYHTNEQILLLGVGKELHISLTAVVTNHGKASGSIFRPVIVQNLSETPVHLVSFSRFRGEPAAAVALRSHQLALGWHKVFIGLDIPLDGAKAALKSNDLQSFQTYCRIGDALAKQLVQICRISTENSGLLLLPYKTVGFLVEVIGLEPTEPSTGHACAPPQLSQIDPLQGEIIPLFGLHFFYGL